MGEQWTPDQALLADATDEQLVERFNHLVGMAKWTGSEYGESDALTEGETVAIIAREYADARDKVSEKTPTLSDTNSPVIECIGLEAKHNWSRSGFSIDVNPPIHTGHCEKCGMARAEREGNPTRYFVVRSKAFLPVHLRSP